MMNSQIHLTDEQFSLNNTAGSHLLIRLSDSSYSYAIVDKDQNRPGVLVEKKLGMHAESMSIAEKLEIILADNGYLKGDFRKVKISVETKAFTFIPEELYSSADLPQYSKFIGSQPDSAVLSSSIRPYGITTVCAIDEDLTVNLKSLFNDPLLVSQANPFIAGIHKLVIAGNPEGLFLNFNRDNFEAAIIRNGTLEFYNIFDITNADEFNYFLLNLISQLTLDRSTAVSVGGKIEKEDQHFLRVAKYFDKILFLNVELMEKAPDLFKQVPPHRFFSLLSLDLCE